MPLGHVELVQVLIVSLVSFLGSSDLLLPGVFKLIHASVELYFLISLLMMELIIFLHQLVDCELLKPCLILNFLTFFTNGNFIVIRRLSTMITNQFLGVILSFIFMRFSMVST